MVCNLKKLLIGLFYRPPNASTHFEWSIESAANTGHDILILGDFNTDFLYSSRNVNIKHFLSTFEFKNVISEPTRLTDTRATLIYPIFISDGICHLDSGTLDVEGDISDHKATYLTMSFSYDCSSAYKSVIWDYKRASL